MAFGGASKFIAAVVTVAAIAPLIYPSARAIAQPVRHAAVEPTGPARFVLHESALVPLVFAEDLSSETVVPGKSVSFVLADDIKVGGVIVARAGGKAFGQVVDANKAQIPGRSGSLSLRLTYLQAGDRRIRLRGSPLKEDEGGVQFSRPFHLKWPMGLLRTGDDVEIQKGTPITAYVAANIALPAAR
jgi:hypothetical protein